MTVSTTHTRKEYIGNGILATYPFDFQVLASSDLRVYVNGSLQILGVHYSVTGTLPGTGNVVFGASYIPAADAVIVLQSDSPATQATDLDAGQKFYEADVEAMSDKLTLVLQQFKNRSVLQPLGSALAGPLILPEPVANRYLRFNGAASGLEAVAGAADLAGVLDDVVPSSGVALFPLAGIVGRLRRASDNVRGLWLDDGVQWVSMGNGDVNVRNFGATGDGVTDDTAAIQAAIAAAPDYSTIVFPYGTYKIGQVVFNGRNLSVEATGATFTMSGNTNGFLVKGVVTWFRVRGGKIVGDGVNRDGLGVTFAQVGWLFGNEPGAYVQNVIVEGVRIEDANIGFKFAAGTGVGSGEAKCPRVLNCEVLRSKGIVGGLGYGFQFSGASGGYISGCLAEDCGRHGIYFAEGRDYRGIGNRLLNHRLTEGDVASNRAAFAVARSAEVTVVGNTFDNCDGGSLMIDTDNAGTPPDNVLRGVTVSGNVFRDSKLQDLIIGSVAPATQGEVEAILVSGNMFFRDNAQASSIIDINSGRKITIQNNQIFDNVAAAHCPITLEAYDGAAYSREIIINGNTITTQQTTTIQVPSALCGGSSLIDLSRNHVQKEDGTIIGDYVERLAAVTNINLFISDFFGYHYESNVNADITPWVAGVTAMTISNTAPTNITNFDGGRSGQVLVLRFADGNTTLKATNIYLAGAIDFIPTVADIVTLVNILGVWFEVSRSVN